MSEDDSQKEQPATFAEQIRNINFSDDHAEMGRNLGNIMGGMFEMISNATRNIPPPVEGETPIETAIRTTQGFGEMMQQIGLPVMDQNMINEINVKVAVTIYFKECLATMDLKSAIRDTKQKFNLADDYRIKVEIDICMGDGNNEKAEEPTVD